MRSITLFSLLFFFSSQALSALKITIDPGHGGSEKGAVHAGVIESNVALQISKKLYKRLKNDSQFRVQLLRSKDVDLELEDRVEKSNDFNTDLFISIHANANPNPKASGVEFYIQNQLTVDQEDLFLAHKEYEKSEVEKSKPTNDIDAIIYDIEKSHKILKSYQVGSYLRKKWTKPKRRMIRQGPFYVLSQNEIPAVLVEVGYLSNPKERKHLVQRDYQHELAKKIHLALKDYAKNMDKLPSGILEPQNAKTR